MKRLLFAFVGLVCFCSQATAQAPAFSWQNTNNTSFLSASTIVVGSTNALGTNGSIAAGDILITMLLSSSTTPTFSTTPSGWTQIGSNINDGTNTASFWYKVAGVGETGNYTWIYSSSTAIAWVLMDYTGASSTPLDAFNIANSNTGGTNIDNSGLTPTKTPDVLIYMTYNATANLMTGNPTGMTQRVNVCMNSGGGDCAYVADKALSGTAATGTISAQSSGGAFHTFMTGLIALAPPAAGGNNSSLILTGVGQ